MRLKARLRKLNKTTENKEAPGTYDSVQITVSKDSESTYNLVKEALYLTEMVILKSG